MGFDIYALDNEFAVSTGSNVLSGGGVSSFDYPPTSSLDLIITTKDGDPDPRLFEIGATYDLAWRGNGAGGSITDAVVVRSDPANGGGGIIVFQGVDDTGALAQVVWTPDFDLESWYFDNFVFGIPPVFNVGDQDPAYTHGYVCFSADTPIASPHGPIRAGDICAGDLVDTLDHGAQPVAWTGRRRVRALGGAAPVRFAPGSIGNEAPLRLSPNHRVLLRSYRAELFFGLPEVLVPAKAMVNGGSIRLAPCSEIDYVHLLFDRHELIWAADAICESLFLGDEAHRLLALSAGTGDVPPARTAPEGRSRVRAARRSMSLVKMAKHSTLPSAAVT